MTIIKIIIIMSKHYRMSLEETAKILQSADCHTGNQALDNCLLSLRGGNNHKTAHNHLKAHGDVSWDKYSSATLLTL